MRLETQPRLISSGEGPQGQEETKKKVGSFPSWIDDMKLTPVPRGDESLLLLSRTDILVRASRLKVSLFWIKNPSFQDPVLLSYSSLTSPSLVERKIDEQWSTISIASTPPSLY